MPGVFGVAGAPLSHNNHAATLRRMGDVLRHHHWYQEVVHSRDEEGIALGRIGLNENFEGDELARNEDGSLLAVFDGELYDYDEHRQVLAAGGHRFRTSSRAELLLHGYEEQGPRFFRGLRGKFIAAIWDCVRRRLVLVNDRFGMRPLYYAHVAGRVVFAAEIKAILADPHVSRNRNLRGIAQFFTYGQLFDNDTLVESVRLLPPAGCLTFDATLGQVEVTRYWKLEIGIESGRSEKQRLDRIDDAFSKSVERCFAGPGRLGLSLSGGLDARTILGVANDQIPLTTVCIGVDGSMDHRSSAEMARLTKRSHHAYLLGEGFLARFEEHLRVTWCGSPMGTTCRNALSCRPCRSTANWASRSCCGAMPAN